MGLAASLHCVGMCGPLNLLIHNNQSSQLNYSYSTALYHTGRISIYIFIGLVLGTTTSILNLKYIQNITALFSAALILIYLTTSLNKRVERIISNTFIYKKVQEILGKTISGNTYKAKLYSGVLNGMLPCGLVYLAATTAALSGSIINTILFMLFFGLGTLPALVILPTIFKLLPIKNYRNIKYISSALLMIVCVVFIIRGLNLSQPVMHWFMQSGGKGTICE